MSLAPGSVYFGTLTGAEHLVAHQPPRLEAETCDGHSVTCMIRTTLWPGFRSRNMKGVPEPADMFQAVASSFAASLRYFLFKLPNLQQCKENMPGLTEY